MVIAHPTKFRNPRSNVVSPVRHEYRYLRCFVKPRCSIFLSKKDMIMSNLGPVSDGKLTSTKAITDAVSDEFKLRGNLIRVDAEGFVSLNDIHRAAGFSENKRPAQWQRLPTTNPLIIATYERVVGKSHKGSFKTSAVYRATTATGTWAHPILAAAYAGYLKPELEVEMREVWLRYRSSDATLADEILQQATSEQNEWAARRAMGRSVRGAYTAELHERGVIQSMHFAICTNETYSGLFGSPAKKLKEVRGLPKKANLRDHMSMKELAFLAASEALAVERMEDEDADGFPECKTATAKAAGAIRSAIDTDRQNRQRKLV